MKPISDSGKRLFNSLIGPSWIASIMYLYCDSYLVPNWSFTIDWESSFSFPFRVQNINKYEPNLIHHNIGLTEDFDQIFDPLDHGPIVCPFR